MKTWINKFTLIALSLLMVLTLLPFSASAEDTVAAETEAAVTEVVTAVETGDAVTEADTTYETPWQCPDCSIVNQSGRYCTNCKLERPEVTTWTCENKHEDGTVCGAQNNGIYCKDCGATRPEAKVEVEFQPQKFVDNLVYMAAGMIGIFLVIGVIILTIVLLGKLTAPKKKAEEE